MRKKVISAVAVTLTSALLLSGCSFNFIKYYLRKSPKEAMEEYLEEKYDDDVTCISWSMEDNYLAYWNKSCFSGKFTSEKYPGVTINVGATLKDNKMEYTFHDDYQQETYREGVNELMEDTAAKYFNGEYYVVTKDAGKVDDESVEYMEFDEYVKRWLRYTICIFVDDMPDDEAYDAMLDFVEDAQGQGFKCDFYLGKPNEEKRSSDEFFDKLENDEDFDFWYNNNVIWLYQKKLSLSEEDASN
jgi:hypothetical protein